MVNLSVIIPTYNRSRMLAGVLESIGKQALDSQLFEVIVVNNGSIDDTEEVVKRFAQKIFHLRYFYEESPGLHNARHKGFSEAKAEILVYADDDIEALPSWLEAIREGFADEEVVLLGGRNLPKFEVDPPEWLLQMWERGCPEGKILGHLSILDFGDAVREISPLYVFGCNYSIRKSVLLEAGGFHPDSMPEDMLMFRGDGETHVSKHIKEHGYKTLYHPKASVYHMVPKARMTEQYFCMRAYRQGISDSYTRIRAGGVNSRWKSFRIKFKRKLRLMWNNTLEARMQNAYWEGYFHHHYESVNDPQLFEWVNKKSYMAE